MSIYLYPAGVEEWNDLAWSRKQYFPFILHSTSIAKLLWVLKIASIELWPVAALKMMLLCIAYLPGPFGYPEDDIPLSQTLRYVLPAESIVMFYMLVRVAEHRWQMEDKWARYHFRHTMQKIWASSFNTQDSHKKVHATSSAIYIRGILEFGFIYILLSCVLLGFSLLYWPVFSTFRNSFSVGDGDGSSIYRTWSISMNIFMTVLGFPSRLDDRHKEWAVVLGSATISLYLYMCMELLLHDACIILMYVRAVAKQLDLASQDFRGGDIDASIAAGNDLRTIWLKISGYVAMTVLGFLTFLFMSFGTVMSYELAQEMRRDSDRIEDLFLPFFCTAHGRFWQSSGLGISCYGGLRTYRSIVE